MATPHSIAFHTLGCKLNFSETSGIQQLFEDRGHHVVPFEQAADIYVINTCSVTEFADRKCRKVVRKALKISPEAKIIMIGCYAQLKPDEIANIPGVDLVLGAAEKFNVVDYIETLEKTPGKAWVRSGEIKEVHSFNQSFSFGDRTRSFLKVQDGCDYKCSFCTIPQARGESRSGSIQQIVDQAYLLAENGIKEIVLTGVNIGDFGKNSDAQESEDFLALIKALDKVKGISRYRISSIEPNLCSNEIIEFVSESNKFVPHFHMPLQSGSDELLKKMRRRYKRNLYKERVAKIKDLMPDACIGVDVIVGFPGETENLFEETYHFLKALDISYLHVFTYSERANTKALELEGVVPVEIRRERNKKLRILSEKKRRSFYEQHLLSTKEVLIEEGSNDTLLEGFTENYIRVEIPVDKSLVNTLQHVKLGEIQSNGHVAGKLRTSVPSV